ncbi:MAG: hypothetical protein QF659_02165 [Dehalococcoidia bacterium]|jgi:hypothetical protein|nr:hypothetical protein [Dehalococcoidia bacterium]
MATRTSEIKNLRLISHHDLNGFGNIGEGVALQQLAGGRRILWMAHESAPKEVTAVDVTDLANPQVIAQTELAHRHLRSNSLAVLGDVMLVAYQSNQPGQAATGMGVYDISKADEPRRIGFLDTSGPYSRGVHCLWWVDGEYAHLSTGAADFQPRNQRDDQFYMIVNVKDPAKPVEEGRWWVPGIREGDDQPMPERHPEFDVGHRLHNANVYPERPGRAYLGWVDSGVIILDISDKSRPKMISQLDYHPPFPGFTHTAVPIFSRDLLVVSEEAMQHDNCEDWPKLVWIMDLRLESKPVMISSLPMPDRDDFCARPGRFGAHNIHENQPLPISFQSDHLVFGAFFNAGLRVYDTSNPFQPREVAYFVPPVPSGAGANSVNDVYVDENRTIYAVDRLKGGLYILELTV